jgi:integrase
MTGALVALRWSELCAIKRDDVDLPARTIRVDESLTELGGRLLWGRPKTPAARRTNDLPDTVRRVLAEHLLAFPPLRDQDDPRWDGLVFYGPGNSPVYRKTFARAWSEACSAAGVGHVRAEWLRHTGASLVYRETRDLKQVAAMLGHTTTRMGDENYVQRYATTSREAADAIDALFR